MPSTRNYLEYVLENLEILPDISYRQMMGEYIVYYRGKVLGGIYDDRFLIKRTPSLDILLPDATLQKPYEGAKEMILVDFLDDKERLIKIIEALYEGIPLPKSKK